MASFPEKQESPEPNGLPLVIHHCLPQFNINFKPWLQARFRPLIPSDPCWSTHAPFARVLLCVGPTPVTSQTLNQFPSVECVVGSSAGVDHIDLAECSRRGLKVTNAGDAFSEDVADCTVALLIDVLRRITAADRYVRAGFWPLKGDYPLGSKVNFVFCFP